MASTADEDEALGLLMFRVTIMGAKSSGKTSLVNSYINHTFSQQVLPTQEPTLYYTTIRIKSEDDDSIFSALFEIEDTFASDQSGLANWSQTKNEYESIEHDVFYSMWWPIPPAKAKDMSSKKDVMVKGVVTQSLAKPLTFYDSPATHGKYRPLTKNRMGYFILFDSNDEDSYTQGLGVWEELTAFIAKKGYDTKPVIYLVGTKIDADPQSDVHKRVIASAHAFAEDKAVRFYTVSAKEFVGVKKLFRLMAQDIKAAQSLWLLDRKENNALEDALGADGCSIS